MSLMDKILSSTKQVAVVRIQPYQAAVAPSAYRNRNISPAVNNPAIVDVAWNAPVTKKVPRGERPINPHTPSVNVIGNGVAPVSGTIAPRRVNL